MNEENKINKNKLFLRILVSLIVLALLAITFAYNTFRVWFKYLKYGGEWMTYEKDTPARMSDIFEKLKENRGGKRAASGRKKADYKTKTIAFRVRVEFVERVKKLVKDAVAEWSQNIS